MPAETCCQGQLVGDVVACSDACACSSCEYERAALLLEVEDVGEFSDEDIDLEQADRAIDDAYDDEACS